MKRGKAAKALLLGVLAMGLVSCGNNPNPPSSSENSSTSVDTVIPVTGVRIQSEPTELEVGQSLALSIEVSPSNATNQGFDIVADKEDAVSISGTTITALKAGEVTLTVTTHEGNFTDSIKLSIFERRTIVDDAQFLNNLHVDEFAHGEYPTTSGWGLSRPGIVGINKTRLETESLYPVPTENVKTYEADAYGISPSGTNNAGKLTNLLQSLKNEEGNKVIHFQKGTYLFANSITGSNLKDIYLVGEEGTKFVFTGWMSFIVLTQCENFHINKLVFDINPSPTITGTVVKVEEDSNNGYIYLKPDEGYDLSNAEYQKYKLKKTGSYAEYYYDPEFDAYVPDRSGNLFYNPGLKDLSYDIASDLLKVTLSKSFFADTYKTPEIGTIASVAYQVYESHGFYFKDCVNTTMEDVTTYTVGGMGLRTDAGKNLYLNRVNFIREPGTKRLLTCTADILHTCNLEGDAVFTNCILEGSHDDAINVKSFYTKITAIKDNVTTVAQTQSETTIRFDVGDEIDVYDPSGMKYKNTYKVVGVEAIGTTYDLTLDRAMPSRGSSSYVGFNLGNATKSVHLTLDNCLIKNKRNRGVLLQGRHSVIKNCTFSNVNMGAVQILGVDDTFKEAIVPQDIQVLNTKFLSCWDDLQVFTWDAKGVATSGTLKDVTIQNNFFYHGTGNSLRLKGVGNISVKNNLFYEQSVKNYSCKIDNAEDVTLEGNSTYFGENKVGYNFASVASTTQNIIQKDNSVKGALK